jgi:hypothetical protein
LVLSNENGAVRTDPGEYNSQLPAPGPSWWWRENLAVCLAASVEQQWQKIHQFVIKPLTDSESPVCCIQHDRRHNELLVLVCWMEQKL